MIERTLRAYTRLCVRAPWWLLAVYAAITAGAVALGAGIRVDTALEALLPEDAPSVVALEEARARRGSQEQFVIAVESPEPLATVQFVDALAEQLADWEEIESVDVVRDQSFFRDRALLYLPVEDLERIDTNLRRIIRQRLGRENPLFEDLETDVGEADWEWRDWRLWLSPYTLAEIGVEQDAIGTLFPFLATDADGDDDGDAAGPGAAAPNDDPAVVEAARIRAARSALPEQYRDYQMATNGRVAVFAARLKGTSTDVEYARRAYERGMSAIAAANPGAFHPELRAQVVGAYRIVDEVRAVTRDASRATQFSLVMVTVLIVGFFRSARALYIVIAPLLVGVAWTLGAIELMFGHLNTLTLFVFSMLIGMGIDFAIHLYRRIEEERAEGASLDDACFAAVARTGRALVTATVTTVVSLLMLVFAHFDGFREFGVACGLGVAMCLLVAVLVIPPLVAASERVWPTQPRQFERAGATPGVGGSLVVFRAAAFVLVAVAAGGAAVADRVAFEYDFANLEAPPDPDRIRYGAALGRTRSSAPAILLGESEQQLREASLELSRRLRADDPLLRGYMTIETAVPGDQEARMEVIDRIYDALDRRAVQNIDGDEGDVIKEMTRLAQVEPFTIDDLPAWSAEMLRERDGSVGALGLLYGNYNDSDAREVARFQKSFASIEVPSGTVRVSSNGFIVADVVRYVIDDAARLAFLVTLGLVVVLWLDLRRWRAVLACLATMVIATGLTVAVMVALDIRIGLYNVIVLPTVLGVGIDSAVHLYHRYLEEGRGATWRVMRTTGSAVIASSLTTVAGFAGLLFVEHQGVRTIGLLAVTGVLASLIAALVLVPAIVGRAAPATPAPSPSMP